METNLQMEKATPTQVATETGKVLFLSYWFPPHPEVGGLRIARFCRYLPEFGVQPYVVCSGLAKSGDDSFSLPKNVLVERVTGSAHPLDIYRKYKAQLLPRPSSNKAGERKSEKRQEQDSNHSPGFVLRHVFAALYYPDLYWTWKKSAYAAARKIVEKHGVRCVVSSGPPWVTHVVAKALKRDLGVRWLADYRDPWVEELVSWFPRWYRQGAARLDRNCVHEADAVVCNTERMREAFTAKFSGEMPSKFKTIPNGFETLDQPSRDTSAGRRKVILHLGTIYGNRKIDGFCRALLKLMESGDLRPESHVVEFYGVNDANYEREAKQKYPQLFSSGLLSLNARIPFAEARARMWASDVLLIFQGDHPLCVPAKYYECAQTGIPIVAITRKGALTDIIEECSVGVSADPDDSDAMARALMSALRTERRMAEVDGTRLAKYQSRVLAGKLAELVTAESLSEAR
jgi:glycosyltransferase involved in cell wall biosynthesis